MPEKLIQEFCYNDHNWFKAKYFSKTNAHSTRYWTFKIALNLLIQRMVGSPLIVETGCVRLEDDYGAGNSSLIFGDFLKKYGGKLISIDINQTNVALCEKLMLAAGFSSIHQTIVDDSLKALTKLIDDGIKPDLIYLDSFDFPYGELLNFYGGDKDLHSAINVLKNMTTDEIINLHGKIFSECQEHCLREAQLANLLLGESGIILIDDLDLPGLGKPRLARDYLLDSGWEIVLEDYQSLFVRK